MSVVRAAAASDVPRIAEVELEAGALFRTVGMDEVAGHEVDLVGLTAAITAGRAWVAELDGVVGGFVVGEVLDGNAHVAQVSVAPSWGRRGLGRTLVRRVEAWGRDAGCPATTLTTFRDVPWNGPYYARLGYRELRPDELGPELAAAMAHEASIPGIDGDLRCAMLRPAG